MAVPEASVYETNGAMFREHQIRLAWYVRSVKPVPETTPVKSASQKHFGFRILTLDPAHDEPTLFRRQYVGDFGSFHIRSVRLQRCFPSPAN